MRHRSIRCTAAVVAMPVVVGAQQPALARIDSVVRAEMSRQKIPGVAVAVVKGGTIMVSKGYGESNLELHVPVSSETLFQSGSVGKQFTSAAVMLLVEDGKIGLADSITKYFPNAPASWRGITVRHLLTHTSGIPDYTTDAMDYVRAGFFPAAAKAYQQALQGTGLPDRVTLYERTVLGDDRIYVYEVAYGARVFRVRLGLAPDDKVSTFSLRRP